MFGSVLMECKACKKEVEAELACHGPGVCIIDFDCGHTMNARKGVTTWRNNKTGLIDLEEKDEPKA